MIKDTLPCQTNDWPKVTLISDNTSAVHVSIRLPQMKRPRPSPKAILRGHTSALTTLAFLPTLAEPDRYLLSGDEKGTIRLWDVTFEETLVTHPVPNYVSVTPVQAIAVHPEVPTSVLVQYKTGHVSLLDLTYDPLATDLDSWTIKNNKVSVNNLPDSVTDVNPPDAVLGDSFCCAAFLSSDTWAGPGGDGSALIIRDNRVEYLCVEVLKMAEKERTGMLMTLANGGKDLLLTGYEDGSVAVWDMRKPNLPISRIKVGQETVLAIAVSPFGHAAAIGGAFDTIGGLADIETELHLIESASLKKPGIADIAWRPDGKLIASAGWDGAVRIWDGRRRPGSLLRSKGSFLWHDGTVQSVAYSHGGSFLASGGKDRTIALWEGI